MDGFPLLGTAFVLIVGATFVNQAKRAWEKHYDTKHALRNIAGTTRNASRHYIRTAHRLNRHRNHLINKKTFEKSFINLELVSDVLKTSCAIIGSAKITYAAHRLILNMRNFEIDVARLIQQLNDYKNYVTYTKNGNEVKADVDKLEEDNRKEELDYLFVECASLAYILDIVSDKIENASEKAYPLQDIFYALFVGETLFVRKTNSDFIVGSYIVNGNRLIQTCTRFMDEPGDTDDLVGFIDRIPFHFGPDAAQKVR